MTDKEKAIVMAFTGVAMLEGEKFDIYHEYIQKVCDRPIWTHELADRRVMDEIKEKSRDDFLSVCRSEDPIDRVLEIIDSEAWSYCDYIIKHENGNSDKQVATSLLSENIREAVLALKGEQE